MPHRRDRWSMGDGLGRIVHTSPARAVGPYVLVPHARADHVTWGVVDSRTRRQVAEYRSKLKAEQHAYRLNAGQKGGDR